MGAIKKIKVRMKNWYWGNFSLVGQMMDSTKVDLKNSDFKPYIESIHGWQHSEEWRISQMLPFNESALQNFKEQNNL